MARKLTQEYVFNFYGKENYFLNSIYKGALNKDKVTCPVGHNIEMTFSNFKQGYRCGKCSGNEKHTHDSVKIYYKDENYILNSIYKNCMFKDKVTCPEGHDIKMSFNGFKNQNKRCLICSGKEQHSQEYIYNYYKEYNYILNSIYNGCKNKDKVICSEGHNIEIKFDDFKQGHRCKICYFENKRGKNHPNYNKDRTRLRRANSLSFDLKNIEILKDDPLYVEYLVSYNEAKEKRLNGEYHSKSKMVVDHIFPRIAIINNNLDIIYEMNLCQKIINLRENLRIISHEHNGFKGGKYNKEEFMNWFNDKLINI